MFHPRPAARRIARPDADVDVITAVPHPRGPLNRGGILLLEMQESGVQKNVRHGG